MIYHFVVGDEAAKPLQEAIEQEPSIAGEIIVLKDILNVGPLQKEEGQGFSALRTSFWQKVVADPFATVQVDDMERMLEVSKKMFDDEEVNAWFWMAPLPADVCAYYWLLPYLTKHMGRFFLVNIAGLPFLDEQDKVFYPRSIAEILPKELLKARRLARPVTAAEMEIDGEEWNKRVQENAGIRTLEGGKKIVSRDEHFYDNILLGYCTGIYRKAGTVVGNALTKNFIPTGDVYLGWRLKMMAEAGTLLMKGDPGKTLKDFDVKLPGSEVGVNSQSATE